jgi:hypothetical protein
MFQSDRRIIVVTPPLVAELDLMVAVAQLVEHEVVILGVAGSSPVGHPFPPIKLYGRLVSIRAAWIAAPLSLDYE